MLIPALTSPPPVHPVQKVAKLPQLIQCLLVVAFLFVTAPAEAQKNCKKGIPCGNTCIAANKTCRVGTGSARSTSSPPQAVSSPAPAGARFVASSKGQVYYLLGCSAGEQLSPANRIYFQTEEEAAAAGYRPSTARGCGTGVDASANSSSSGPAAAAPAPQVLAEEPNRAASAGTCIVGRVYDGDTVTCRSGERIRLLLIDTPEMDQAEIGRSARTELLRLMPLGTTVRLEHDVEKQDRYGRTLAYLWLPDGRMVNEEMARAGYALSLTYPPNVRYVDRIRAAVEEAKRGRRGLWATSAFECSPRDYRAKRCG